MTDKYRKDFLDAARRYLFGRQCALAVSCGC